MKHIYLCIHSLTSLLPLNLLQLDSIPDGLIEIAQMTNTVLIDEWKVEFSVSQG